MKITVRKDENGTFSLFLQHRRSLGLKPVSVTEATREDIADIVGQEQQAAMGLLKERSARQKAKRAV